MSERSVTASWMKILLSVAHKFRKMNVNKLIMRHINHRSQQQTQRCFHKYFEIFFTMNWHRVLNDFCEEILTSLMFIWTHTQVLILLVQLWCQVKSHSQSTQINLNLCLYLYTKSLLKNYSFFYWQTAFISFILHNIATIFTQFSITSSSPFQESISHYFSY